MKRFLTMVLILSIFTSGCAGKSQVHSAPFATQASTAPTAFHPTVPEPTEAAAVQIPLTQKELETIMQNAEFSLLAAAFLYDAYQNADYSYDRFAYVGDVDKDGQTEMYYSQSLLYFDPTDGKSCGHMYSPSGSHNLHIAKGGTVYYSYYGEMDFITHTDHEDSVSVLHYSSRSPDAVDFAVCTSWCLNEEQMSWVRIEGQDLTVDESKTFLQQMGLTLVTTDLRDYTSFVYDAVYTDSILASLETAFGLYYYGSYSLDIDRDGEEERLFFYKDFVPAWFPQSAINPNPNDYDSFMDQAFFFEYPRIDPHANRTGLIVADKQSKNITLKAYSIPMEPAWYEDNAAYIQGAVLHLYGEDWFVPQAQTGMQDQLTALDQLLQQKGYTNCFFTTADLSNADQDEILCLGDWEGIWNLLVVRFEYGIPIILEKVDLSASACYLTEIGGKKCLLVYSQSISQQTQGLYTAYSYQLMRFDEDSGSNILDSNHVGYYNDQEDAQSVSDFFEALNRYIAKVIVLCDPFDLHGQQWISPENVVHGTAPEEPQPDLTPEEQTEKLAFVNISNPNSWLNLREGPGRDYPCIQTDPDDPNSIVKQAKGAPVTILETVISQDSEFPIWYKVRIRYQNREIIGYSAEAYIKIAQ